MRALADLPDIFFYISQCVLLCFLLRLSSNTKKKEVPAHWLQCTAQPTAVAAVKSGGDFLETIGEIIRA